MAKTQDPYLMAQFKFGLIAPIVQKTYPDASIAAYCRRVTGQPLTLPDGTQRQYSPKSLEIWAGYYKKGGLDALVKQPRRDKGDTRALSGDAAARICELKGQFQKLPATQIRLRLLEEGLITSKVSDRCVQRFLKDWDLKQGRPPGGKDRKAFEAGYFGELWQADSCHFPHIPDGGGKKRRTYLIMIIDDHSRLIVGARIYFSDNAENFQLTLKSAVATYGIAHKLFCDNGGPYACRQTEFICADVGILLLHAKVRDGAAKGKVERAFRSVKDRWLHGLDISTVSSLEEFNLLLAAHVREYNLTVHSSIGETPMDRFLATRDRIKAPESRDWLDHKFMNRLNRKVGNDATIKLEGAQWDVPMQFIGYTVEVRFAPGGDAAYIVVDGGRHHLKKTDKLANSRTKRADAPGIDYSKIGGKDDDV